MFFLILVVGPTVLIGFFVCCNFGVSSLCSKLSNTKPIIPKPEVVIKKIVPVIDVVILDIEKKPLITKPVVH